MYKLSDFTSLGYISYKQQLSVFITVLYYVFWAKFTIMVQGVLILSLFFS